MFMWVDLQLKYYMPNEKKLLILDNFSAHVSNLVNKHLCDNNIIANYLLPNTTSKYQVIDLVINGPLKNAIRDDRSKELSCQLRRYRSANKDINKFKFKNPSIYDGMVSLTKFLKAYSLNNKTTIINCFRKTGIIPFEHCDIIEDDIDSMMIENG